MKIQTLTLFALFTIISQYAAAQSCEGIDEIRTATPNTLFDHSLRCDDMVEAVLLMSIGQIRTLTDLSAFPPSNESSEKIMADLYGRLYYQMGGSGPDRLMTNQQLYQSLVARISDWSPIDLESYKPGWDYLSTPTYEGYFASIESKKAFKLSQLSRYHLLLNDPEYLDLHTEMNEILKRNNNQLVVGTEDADEYKELSERANQIKARLREAVDNNP